MKGDALANMLKDRRILVIIIAAVVIIAAVAAYVVLKDDGGNGGSDDPSDGLTIDNERTISEDMVIEGTLTIGENGKLTLTDGAEIKMLGANAKVDVKGTLDATDGSITFVKQEEDGSYTPVYQNGNGETRSVTSTGQLIMTPNDFASQDFLGNITGIMYFANGALYVNSDEFVVLTTAANAAAANSDVEIFGTVNENSNITISNSEELTIMDGANVTLGTITLSGTSTDSPIIDATGKLSASVTATGAGTLKLVSVNGITIDLDVTTSGSATTTEISIDGTLSGAASVTGGTINAGTLTVNGTGNTLAVDSGATLILGTGSTITAGASADGKTAAISVAGNITFDGGNIRAAGTVKALLNVTGTMTVLDPTTIDGTVNLNGVMTIGEKPTDFTKVSDNNATITASIILGADSYIKVYGDGNFTPSGTTKIKSTVFNVNGKEYMTVYAIEGDVAISAVLKDEAFVNGSTSVAAMSDFKNWNQDEYYLGEMLADNKNIGESDYTEVNYQTSTVDVKFTIPKDTSVEIGELKISENDTVRLVVGYSYTVNINGGSATYNGSSVSTTFSPVSGITDFVVIVSSTTADEQTDP